MKTSELLDKYWDLAYKEGLEGRNHDTIEGVATETRAAIDERVDSMEWISVKDRLPDVDTILVCVEYLDDGEREIQIGHLSEFSPKSTFEGFCPLYSKRFRKTTHWMSLPELPESIDTIDLLENAMFSKSERD